MDKEANSIISDAKLKARNILLDAKEEANEVIKELNNKSTNVKTANSIRNKLNSSINELSELDNVKTSNSLTNENVYIGQEVFYAKLNSNGTILSLPNKSNEVKLQIGSMNMNVKLEDLASLKSSRVSSNSGYNKPSSISFSNNKAQSISSEINVIGLNVDQAIPIIDKYLDDCSMANLEQARIVHGKGTGKLRIGIHNFLKKHPHVKSFRLGTFGEGEMGVTIVYLK